MKNWLCQSLWTADGWQENMVVTTNAHGRITHISAYNDQEPLLNREHVQGWCIPSITNAHSHAFQYAMAGVAERRTKNKNDSFWAWRESMYSIANQINPEQLKAIATRAYSQMVTQGFREVVEFHYLHHLANPTSLRPMDTEMAMALVEASAIAGIDLTIVPIYYKQGGFGKAAQPEQRRFVWQDVEHYISFCDHLSTKIGKQDHVRMGLGVHSIRAADKDDLAAIADEANRRKCIFHIHIAEQMQEVNQCLDHFGARPVEWLLDNISVEENIHLVHATHVSDSELQKIQEKRCTVIICPTTEANLGDGIFPFAKFKDLGGSWAIGTDSHVCTNAFMELQLLEYGQRLQNQKRLVGLKNGELLADDLWYEALIGGNRSAGKSLKQPWTKGDHFAATVINPNHPQLGARSKALALSTCIFAAESGQIAGSLRGNEWIAVSGKHRNQEEIDGAYLRTVQDINSLHS